MCCSAKSVAVFHLAVGRFSIAVAAGPEDWYYHDMSEPESAHAIKITGKLQLVEAADRVLVTFDAMVHHAEKNVGIEVTFQSEGSAIVQFDKKLTVATLGDAQLTVTATVEE